MALGNLFSKDNGNKTAPPTQRPLSGDETTTTTGSLADEKMPSTATAPESRSPSHDTEMIAMNQNKSAQDTAKKTEHDDDDEEEDDTEYPKAMKLALISIALCLSVFCMVSGVLVKSLAASFALTTILLRPLTTPS
jgi:hypothetical protein